MTIKIDLRSEVLNKNIVTVKKLKEDLTNKNLNKDKAIGVFFFKENDETTNFLTYGDNKGKKADKNIFPSKVGPLSFWIDNYETEAGAEPIQWYAVNISKEKNIASNLFLTTSDTGGDGLIVNQNLIKDEATSATKYVSNLAYDSNSKSGGATDYNDSTKNKEASVKAVAKDSLKSTNPEDYDFQIRTQEGSFSNYNVKSGTTMFFNTNHTLNQIIDFASLDTSGKDQGLIRDYYKDYLEAVIKNIYDQDITK